MNKPYDSQAKSNWHRVKIAWLSSKEGGRQASPPIGKYFCVSKFSNDFEIGGSWSVQFELNEPTFADYNLQSEGICSFLVGNAPHENFLHFDAFEIYEGPKKVGLVKITDNSSQRRC